MTDEVHDGWHELARCLGDELPSDEVARALRERQTGERAKRNGCELEPCAHCTLCNTGKQSDILHGKCRAKVGASEAYRGWRYCCNTLPCEAHPQEPQP